MRNSSHTCRHTSDRQYSAHRRSRLEVAAAARPPMLVVVVAAVVTEAAVVVVAVKQTQPVCLGS